LVIGKAVKVGANPYAKKLDFFKKSIDKSIIVCYNKGTVKETKGSQTV